MPDELPNAEVCCLPGDITVTKIPTGYLIGRALDPRGPGPWWDFIAIVSTYEEAANHAIDLARRAAVRAWLQKDGNRYEPLKPTDGSTE